MTDWASHPYKHGHASHKRPPTPTYNSWATMRQRCLNPRNPNYPNYGGRGIVVCERWDRFTDFLADMGERPVAKTLERRDNDGNYEPDNCYWATKREQVSNTRRNRRLTFNGVTRTATEWAEVLGVKAQSLRHRVRAGHSVEDVLNPAYDGKTVRKRASAVVCVHEPLPKDRSRCKRCGRKVSTSSPLTINGVTRPVREWAKYSPVKRVTIERRLKQGWDAKTAVFTPRTRSQPVRTVEIDLGDVRMARRLLR